MADSYKTYDSGWATEYAEYNYKRHYGSGSSKNPFSNFDVYQNGELVGGGNCTNFVSQAIIAGLAKTKYASTAYSKRYQYDIDAGGGGYQWYFRHDNDRGPAFTGAHKMWEYAKYNKSHYKGLHFEYVTHDTATKFMDYEEVLEGDVVFADWENDGHFDHTMLVTDIQWWKAGYNEIRVTYQGTQGLGKKNRGLGDINEENDYEATFYVYRPVNYNPNGL